MEVTFQVGYTEIDARQIPVACLLFFFFFFCALLFGEAIIRSLLLQIKPPISRAVFPHHPTMLLDVITVFSKNFALIA